MARAKVFVIVRDIDSQVIGVYRETPVCPTGHTCLEEEYNGPTHWNNPETPVFRHGIDDFRLEVPV